MQGDGHEHLTTRKCGFIIHPTMGWLRASPDAMVTDPSSVLPNGIAQFKCPFSKKDTSPTDACVGPNFYCTIQNGTYA